MAEVVIKTTDFPSNSNREKIKESRRPRVEKVVSTEAALRKKPLGKQIKETFTGDDINSVGTYVLFEVLIPAAKMMLSDMVHEGFDRYLFGGTGRGTGRRTTSQTNYNRLYSQPEKKTVISQRARSKHDFDEIELEDRGEAETVIDTLIELIDTYGAATVGDMYDAAGVSHQYTDNAWGWTDLKTASVQRTRQGTYILDLPKPRELDRNDR